MCNYKKVVSYSDRQVQHQFPRIPLLGSHQTIRRQGFEVFFVDKIQQINLQNIDFTNIMQHRAHRWISPSLLTSLPLSLSLSLSRFTPLLQLYQAVVPLICSITINGVCFVLAVIPLRFLSFSIFLKIGYVFILKALCHICHNSLDIPTAIKK